MPRVLLLRTCLLVLACWFTLAAPARAAESTVCIVPTEGPKGWLAAERRLTAELRATGLRVLVLPAREGPDHELARHAAAFGAIASVQVLREGEFGVIRVWLERDASRGAGFRHVRVNLRGPEVVSHAVLPVVELVYLRSIEVPKLEPDANAKRRPPGRRQLGAPVWGPPVRYHVRSDMMYAARLGVGPWFAGAETTPAINVGLGLRAHWFTFWSLEPELFMHAVAHGVQVPTGVGTLPVFGARAHWLFEPWPKSSVSVGIGPGLGTALVRSDLPRRKADPQQAYLLSGRAEIASALAPYVDVLFLFTFSYDLAETPSFTEQRALAHMFRPALDAQLALDWHWQ